MPNKLLAAGAFAALLFAACTPSRPEPPKPECTYDSECDEGQVCGPSGRCAAACAVDRDCAVPLTCSEGACVLPTGKCRSSADCASDEVCGPTSGCAKQCAIASDCGSGKACIESACLTMAPDQCERSSDCPANQACVNGKCAQACAETRDCPAGSECVSGLCSLPKPECLGAADCSGGKVCSPGAKCVAACTSVANCAASGEACSNGACVTVGPDTATVAGSITITGETDHSGTAVLLKGTNNAAAVSAADGSYRFEGLAPSTYQLVFTAASTVEGTLTRDLFARAGVTTSVAAAAFTPAGAAHGSATMLGKTNHQGINVLVSGTSRSALTDAAGTWSLDGLAAGTYELVFTAPGYLAQTVTGVAVTFKGDVAVSAVALDTPPTATGSTFAFLTTPSTTHRVDQVYSYTAQAAGAGVTVVTYGLTVAPGGMTIDPSTGVLSWTPSMAYLPYSVLVAISARGGGVSIYQVFNIQVVAAVQAITSSSALAVEKADGGLWVAHPSSVSWVSRTADGGYGVSSFTDAGLGMTGVPTSVELLNGGQVTGITWTGGTVSQVTTSAGTLAATFEGGTVGSIAPLDERTVTAHTLRAGTAASVTALGEDSITALSYLTGTVTSVSDGRRPIASLSFPSGVVSAASANVLTDGAAGWTTDEFVGRCLSDPSAATAISITGNTATTFTVASGTDLAQRFPIGKRYFVSDCSGYMRVKLTEPANDLPADILSRRVDLYTSTSPIDSFYVASSPAPTTSTFTFNAPIYHYPVLLSADASGTYGLTSSASSWYHDVVITDTAATFAGGLSSTNRLNFEGGSDTYQIISNTGTQLTVRLPVGELITQRVGQKWLLPGSAYPYRVPVTATVAGGGLAAGAHAGWYLFIDSRGDWFPISGNTTGTYALNVTYSKFPLNGVVGSMVGRSQGSSKLPQLTVTAQGGGLEPGAMANRQFMRTTSNSTPFFDEGDILYNTANLVQLAERYCSPNAGCLAGAKTRITGSTFASGSDSGGNHVDLRLDIGGSPSFSPDELVGRLVAVSAQPSATARVISNGSATIDVAVRDSVFPAFNGMPAGAQLWLSDPPINSTTPMRVRLTDATGGFTAGQWVGYSVTAANGEIAGTVTANTANTVDLVTTNQGAFAAMAGGTRYGLARQHPGTSGCWYNVSVKGTVTLAGATLAAGAYNELRASNNVWQPHLVTANTTGDAEVLVCTEDFGDFVGGLGRQAALVKNNQLSVVIDDTTAAFTPGALVGRRVKAYAASGSASLEGVISANSATSLTVSGVGTSYWIGGSNVAARFAPGSTFAITDTNDELDVSIATNQTFTVDQLAGSVVDLHDQLPSTSAIGRLVKSNDASKLLVGNVPFSQLPVLSATGLAAQRWFTNSAGLSLRITDSSAAFESGALVGRYVELGSCWLQIVANTATTLEGIAADEDTLAACMGATGYSIQPLNAGGLLAVESGGFALVSSSVALGSGPTLSTGLARFGPAGLQARLTDLSTAQQLDVTPKAPFTGVLQQTPVWSDPVSVFSDVSWSFTPGELVGSLIVLSSYGAPSSLVIIANTATSITALGWTSGSVQGRPFAIHHVRLVVSGTTLTPGALAGMTVRLHGIDYLVRGNTASEVHLVPPQYTAGGLAHPADYRGSKAYLLSGLGSEPHKAIAPEGSAGLLVASPNLLVHHDGSSWTRFSSTAAATTFASGTLTEYEDDDEIRDSSANFASNELNGKWLVLGGSRYKITSNSATTIRVSGSFGYGAVGIGAPYSVLNDDGFGSIQSVGASGGVFFVGTSRGLFTRLTNGSWQRFTVANTETSPGLRDGLPFDDVKKVLPLGAADVWVGGSSEGLAHLQGTTWTKATRQSTESAPGKADGLQSNGIQALVLEGGSVWVGHYAAASRLQAGTWANFGSKAGIFNNVYDVAEEDGNRLYATGGGLVLLLP